MTLAFTDRVIEGIMTAVLFGFVAVMFVITGMILVILAQTIIAGGMSGWMLACVIACIVGVVGGFLWGFTQRCLL